MNVLVFVLVLGVASFFAHRKLKRFRARHLYSDIENSEPDRPDPATGPAPSAPPAPEQSDSGPINAFGTFVDIPIRDRPPAPESVPLRCFDRVRNFFHRAEQDRVFQNSDV